MKDETYVATSFLFYLSSTFIIHPSSLNFKNH